MWGVGVAVGTPWVCESEGVGVGKSGVVAVNVCVARFLKVWVLVAVGVVTSNRRAGIPWMWLGGLVFAKHGTAPRGSRLSMGSKGSKAPCHPNAQSKLQAQHPHMYVPSLVTSYHML